LFQKVEKRMPGKSAPEKRSMMNVGTLFLFIYEEETYPESLCCLMISISIQILTPYRGLG